jgi:GNAT superfamily N-acetyltransferase
VLEEVIWNLSRSIRIRRSAKRDISAIKNLIHEWQNWEVPREESIRRAVENKELLVADHKGRVIGLIHYPLHEDIIDGGLNSFITAFYVMPEFRDRQIGSALLEAAIQDALKKGAVGVETSTANPDARRLYEKHHFKQFMGKWTMGEIFLELDTTLHKRKPGNSGNIDVLKKPLGKTTRETTRRAVG